MKHKSKKFKALLGRGLALLFVTVLAGHAVAQTCVQPPVGLVSWWPGDGNTDDIIDANHGALQGGATFALGRVGQAFSFDGANDYVHVAESPNLDIVDEITIEAWIYPNSFSGIPDYLISKYNAYNLQVDSGLVVFGLPGNELYGDSTIQPGNWSHIAGVYDGSAMTIYVNGVLDKTESFVSPIGTADSDFFIGAGCAPPICNSFNNLFNGLIDEVSLYNRALTASEIQAIFAAGSSGKCELQMEELTFLSPATLWIGLKNSDDQGTQFDLRTEVYINDTPVAEGETRCITGVTRNPSKAKEVSVEFGPIIDGVLASGDVLSLKVLTRIGTNPDDTKCSGPGGSHNNAMGLRLYYDAVSRPSRFGAEITPDPLTDFFLNSIGADFFFDAAPPTATSAKFKDSSAVNFIGGNPWKGIGTWDMTLP